MDLKFFFPIRNNSMQLSKVKSHHFVDISSVGYCYSGHLHSMYFTGLIPSPQWIAYNLFWTPKTSAFESRKVMKRERNTQQKTWMSKSYFFVWCYFISGVNYYYYTMSYFFLMVFCHFRRFTENHDDNSNHDFNEIFTWTLNQSHEYDLTIQTRSGDSPKFYSKHWKCESLTTDTSAYWKLQEKI